MKRTVLLFLVFFQSILIANSQNNDLLVSSQVDTMQSGYIIEFDTTLVIIKVTEVSSGIETLIYKEEKIKVYIARGNIISGRWEIIDENHIKVNQKTVPISVIEYINSQGKSSSNLKKNIVYLSVATINYSLNYERIVFDGGNYQLLVKVSGGKFTTSDWSGGIGKSGPQYYLQLIGLAGKKTKHFEYGFGIACRYDKYGYGNTNESYYNGYGAPPVKGDYNQVLPVINIGYRHQKPNGHFLFRVGIGYPEAIYLSFGGAF